VSPPDLAFVAFVSLWGLALGYSILLLLAAIFKMITEAFG
jgi:hypothetical protein